MVFWVRFAYWAQTAKIGPESLERVDHTNRPFRFKNKSIIFFLNIYIYIYIYIYNFIFNNYVSIKIKILIELYKNE